MGRSPATEMGLTVTERARVAHDSERDCSDEQALYEVIRMLFGLSRLGNFYECYVRAIWSHDNDGTNVSSERALLFDECFMINMTY